MIVDEVDFVEHPTTRSMTRVHHHNSMGRVQLDENYRSTCRADLKLR